MGQNRRWGAPASGWYLKADVELLLLEEEKEPGQAWGAGMGHVMAHFPPGGEMSLTKASDP